MVAGRGERASPRPRRAGGDLPHVDADEAWRRLGGLTREQQAEIEKTIRLTEELLHRGPGGQQ